MVTRKLDLDQVSAEWRTRTLKDTNVMKLTSSRKSSVYSLHMTLF